MSLREHLFLSEPGELDRPPIDAEPGNIRELAFGCIRVLTPEGDAVGPWAPEVTTEQQLEVLRTMLNVRAFDARMLISQRQGKTSFAMTSTGEEAIGATTATVMASQDMCFPTYRQAGYLMGRGYPVVDMMNQIYGNEKDPMLGTRLPGLYSSREFGFFTISGGLGTQVPQAVGWAMASKLKQNDSVALAFLGEGSTATSDLHGAMTFASTFKPPVIIGIVDNQYAISTGEDTARGMADTFAQRGIGYGLPSLRVDGNDVLAVMAATRWARERALAGHGATLIEFLTYRAGAHSTSDDPTRYRSKTEYLEFPLGDPIDRFRQHLLAIGVPAQTLQTMEADAARFIEETNSEAESNGTINTHSPPSISHAFDVVYETMPPNLVAQRTEAGL